MFTLEYHPAFPSTHGTWWWRNLTQGQYFMSVYNDIWPVPGTYERIRFTWTTHSCLRASHGAYKERPLIPRWLSSKSRPRYLRRTTQGTEEINLEYGELDYFSTIIAWGHCYHPHPSNVLTLTRSEIVDEPNHRKPSRSGNGIQI